MKTVLLLIGLLTVITGSCCLWRQGPVVFKLVLVSVLCSLVTEQVLIPGIDLAGINHNLVYNFYSLADILLWTIIFQKIFAHRPAISRLIIIAGTTINVLSLLEICILRGPLQFHYISFMCFNAAVVCFAGLYLVTLMRKDRQSLAHEPVLWIVAAALCFHGIFFINLASMFYTAYWKNAFAKQVFHFLQNTAQVIYHFFICLAFLILRRFSYSLREPS